MPVVTLGRAEKIVGILLSLIMVSLAAGGSYALISYRLSEHEKILTSHESRITQQEQLGHPDHERRITKLETRADESDRSINEIKGDLKVALEILHRLDSSNNRSTK